MYNHFFPWRSSYTHSFRLCVYWASSNSDYDGCGSHFSKWPTSVTVMMHICFTGGMQVDGDRLFTNKGPVMVKKVTIIINGLLQGQYLVIKVT